MTRSRSRHLEAIRKANASAQKEISLEVQRLGVTLHKKLRRLMLTANLDGADLKAASFVTMSLRQGIARGLEGWFAYYAIATSIEVDDVSGPAVLSALETAGRMIGSAEQALFLQAVFGSAASTTRRRELSDRINKVHRVASAHSLIRSDVQVAALTAIADFHARAAEVMQEFESMPKVAATREEYLGYRLSERVRYLQPPPIGDILRNLDADPTNAHHEQPNLRVLAYQAVVNWKRRGRPRQGQLGKFEAANRFLAALGLGAASATALEHTWVRRKTKKGLDAE